MRRDAPASTQSEAPPTEILEALRRMHMLGPHDAPLGERLTGGVSSDIWRIDLPDRPGLREACAGQTARGRRLAARRSSATATKPPGCAAPTPPPQVPPPPCSARTRRPAPWRCNTCRPNDYPLWKTQLRDGHADPAFAAQVATTLARIHAATAADPATAAEFPTDAIFFDIRLEPYLRRHRARAIPTSRPGSKP